MAPNQQQAEAWNGGESVHYVDHADRYDRQLAPVTDALLELAALEPHEVALDVGCGSGTTTFAAGARARRVVGLDLSEPLLEVARSRARQAGIENVEFVVADAQTHDFYGATYDAIISQFGLMFFDEPVTAFSNLRASLVTGGRLAFVCWQGLPANDWLMVVGRAVERHRPLPTFGSQAGGPGMFALCEADEITTLLESSSFSQVTCTSIAPTIVLGGGGALDDSLDFLLGMGMVRGLIGQAGEDNRDVVVADVRRELEERYEPGVGVPLGAGAWLVTARN